MVGSSVPAVAGQAFSDEAFDDDVGVGEGDERVDHDGAHFGADREFSDPAVVSGVGALDRPPPGRLERCGFALGRDLAFAAELVQQLPRVSGVVTDTEVAKKSGLPKMGAVHATLEMSGTGFKKDDAFLPYVARQYSGTLGKIGVSIHAVTDQASCLASVRAF